MLESSFANPAALYVKGLKPAFSVMHSRLIQLIPILVYFRFIGLNHS